MELVPGLLRLMGIFFKLGYSASELGLGAIPDSPEAALKAIDHACDVARKDGVVDNLAARRELSDAQHQVVSALIEKAGYQDE